MGASLLALAKSIYAKKRCSMQGIAENNENESTMGG